MDLGSEQTQVSSSTTDHAMLADEGFVPLTSRHTVDAPVRSAIATMVAILGYNAAKNENGLSL